MKNSFFSIFLLFILSGCSGDFKPILPNSSQLSAQDLGSRDDFEKLVITASDSNGSSVWIHHSGNMIDLTVFNTSNSSANDGVLGVTVLGNDAKGAHEILFKNKGTGQVLAQANCAIYQGGLVRQLGGFACYVKALDFIRGTCPAGGPDFYKPSAGTFEVLVNYDDASSKSSTILFPNPCETNELSPMYPQRTTASVEKISTGGNMNYVQTVLTLFLGLFVGLFLKIRLKKT